MKTVSAAGYAITGFFRLLGRTFRLVAPYGRGKLATVLCFIFVTGVFQVLGVGSIFPFFALASDPSRLERSGLGLTLLQLLPRGDSNEALIASGFLAIAVLVLANLSALVTEVVTARYAHGLAHWLRSQMMGGLEQQPYSHFLGRNSSLTIQKLIPDVTAFVSSVLQPLLEIMSKSLTLLFLVVTVFLVHPLAAFWGSVGIGIFYIALFLMIRPRAQRVGSGLWYSNRALMVAATEFFGGIKPILVHQKAQFFGDKFRAASAEISSLQPQIPLYSNSPRYLIEPVAFGSMVLVVISMAWRGQSFVDFIPNLAVLALAAYKILPMVQGLYMHASAVTTMRYTLTEVEGEIATRESRLPRAHSLQERLPLRRELRLDAVSFAYPSRPSGVLNDVSLTVYKNEHIGIAGPTGSGKSTLVDLILGLHEPQRGRVLVDGKPLDPHLMPAWRSSVGYVPQEIFLLDDTVRSNIAFGVEGAVVDYERLKEAAEKAQILHFIENSLPGGFDCIVGERGVRLSGGQRQRIGLARAFYNEPEVLILDEATSSLDILTETAVLETVQRFHGRLTIITVAHRTTSLERCDRVLHLQNGRVSHYSVGGVRLTHSIGDGRADPRL